MDIGDSQSKTVFAGYPQTVEVKEAMVRLRDARQMDTRGGKWKMESHGTKSAGK